MKREEVVEMETRLSGGDLALEGQIDDGEESVRAHRVSRRLSHNEPTPVLGRAPARQAAEGRSARRQLERLDARSRRIIEARWLKVQDDGSGGTTLHELADEFGVSGGAHPPDRSQRDEEDARAR